MVFTLTTGELAAKLGAALEGNPGVVLHGVADLRAAGAGQVSFAGSPRYLPEVAESRAAAVIVPQTAVVVSP